MHALVVDLSRHAVDCLAARSFCAAGGAGLSSATAGELLHTRSRGAPRRGLAVRLQSQDRPNLHELPYLDKHACEARRVLHQ